MDNKETIYTALLKAQIEMTGAKKDSNNPFFSSKYADYNSVLEAVKAPLNDNGIVIVQEVAIQNETSGVLTRLIHAESESEVNSFIPIIMKKVDAQQQGSAITYARRYGLQAIVGLPAEDDDGNLATRGNGKSKPVQTNFPCKHGCKAPDTVTMQADKSYLCSACGWTNKK